MPTPTTFEHPFLYGYRLDQVAQAFDRVRNHRDWKAPIRSTISVADQVLVEIAVRWFTGTIAEFTAVPGCPGMLLVTAPGHRQGPAGHPDELLRRFTRVVSRNPHEASVFADQRQVVCNER